jgi:mycofactocin glycosyltransferase
MTAASVLIPTYNRQDHLDRALAALADQYEPDAPFDVIVVDDGSDPPIRVDETGLPFDVHLVRLDQNRGRAGARNAGLATVTAPLVIFLDDDMRPRTGFVRAHLDAHADGGDLVALGTVRFSPEVPRNTLSVYLDTRGIAKLNDTDPIPFKYFLTYNSSAPTRLLRNVGGFDERLRVWGGEDLELAWRLDHAGAMFIRTPAAIALHAHRRSLHELWRVSELFGCESMPIMLEKHPAMIAHLRAHLLGPRPYAKNVVTRRAFVRVLTTWPLPEIMRDIAGRLANFPWPDRVYDYLIAAAWRRGMDRHHRRTQT